VMSMKTGSVIVDMAVSQGGNCALSKNGEEIVVNGVTIIGEPNLPSLLATNASDLYGKNVAALILHLVNEEKINFDTTEEIIGGSLITHQGEIVNPKLLELLNQK
jgi:NAD(P) transhydrogenase subunit alpha